MGVVGEGADGISSVGVGAAREGRRRVLLPSLNVCTKTYLQTMSVKPSSDLLHFP